MAFGLRYYVDGREIRLMQIAGDGRIRVHDCALERYVWQAVPYAVWEVYEATDGETWETREQAVTVLRNLTK